MERTGIGVVWLCLGCVLVSVQADDVNVAPGKTYNQSSKYSGFDDSSQAANGDTDGHYPDNGIHTSRYDANNPWWEVNLGRVYPLHNITVWARPSFEGRLYPSNITVDGQQCASIQSIPSNSRRVDVTCSSVMYGQTVRITRQSAGLSWDARTLNMAEMQIWVPSEVSECPVGTYGSSCNSQCSQHCGKGPDKNFCYKDTGYCYDGCVAGRYGDQCTTPCSPGCPNTVCDQQSGQCSPCNTGYTGLQCSECQDKYYKTTSNTCVQCNVYCRSQSCDKATGRCDDCVDGRYGDMCDKNCSTANCRRCDRDTGTGCTECTLNSNLKPPDCTDCVDGRYGDMCDKNCITANCRRCDRDNGTGCTECTLNSNLEPPDCTECQDKYYKTTSNTCIPCSDNCVSQNCDKETGRCDDCVDGRYGDMCDKNCSTANCRRCDRDTGTGCTECTLNSNLEPPNCTDCVGGRYGDMCDKNCSTANCRRCDRDTGTGCTECTLNSNLEPPDCTDCVDGRYGDMCDKNCSTANCRRCDRDTGTGCTECTLNSNLEPPNCTECQDKYYKNTSNTCIPCSVNCVSQNCDKATGRCDDCVDGRYGDMCDKNCSTANCRRCDRDTGTGCTECTLNSNLEPPDCTECQDKYYKNTSNTCIPCSVNCVSQNCDKETGRCDDCVDGRYGDMCDKNCSTANCRRCDQGTGTVCTECTLNSNLKPQDCTECQDKYYKNTSNTCIPCSDNCVSQNCDKETGRCDDCVDGRYGDMCDKNCSTANCRRCDRDTGTGCTECTLNSNLEPPNCTECQDGWYGENCMYQCGSCSNDAPCNKTTGLCTCAIGKQPPFCETDCQDKTYGQDCVHSCGQCKGGQTCDPVTGHCSDGCQPGWTDTPSSPTTLCQTECPDGFYGEGCNQTCANCRDISECRHDTGQCTGQCAEGFTGLYCAEAIKGGGIDAPVIAGAVAAGVIVIAIAVFITIFLIRRRKQVPKPNEMPNSVADRGQREELDSSLLAFQPPVRNNTIDAKPVALVKPVAKPAVKPKPSQANAAVYENVSLPQQTSAPKPSPLDQSGAGGPPQKSPKPLPGAERPLLASREPVTEDEEMDAEWSGEQIYNNDPSLLDSFVPATFRLDQLQKTILDSLQDDTVDAEFEHLAKEKEYPVANGKKQENYYKNRFNSILPYDKTRVVLEQVDSDDASDYINASFIKGYKTEKAYIAAQGPRSNTQDDFWRMVWQEGVTDIVMLTNLKEGSKQKCHEYWPARGTSVNTGHMEVTGLEEEERAHFVIRTFNVGKNQGQEKRQVRQYHYVKWMDHEVPTTTPLVDFWRYVRARAPRTPTAPPLLVHCSAGVGRTGTYIALDILMDQSQEEDTISLYTTVSNLRDYRCHMVQNKGQYEFLHEAVLEAYMSGDSRLDTSSFDRIFPSTIRHDQPQPRIDAEFKRLCQMRTCLTHPSHTLASQEENQAKNRNPDALPDDNHIVYITRPSKGRNQYINAVYIPTFLSARGSIVTQLPLADTVIDLWRLVDSWDVTTIVSLGQVKGHKTGVQDTSGCYWPVPDSPAVTCGDYTIILKSCSTLGDSLVTYTVDMKKQDKSHEVRVLHYEAWTGEVADNVPDLLCLLDILHTSHKEPTKQPVIIQCLDGVARSGVVCALWDVISRMTYDGEADVYLAVRHVHTVRPEAITSVMQYRFIYQVVKHHLDSYNVYANT
ncbi:uncharacterized protein LOC143299914 isoform X3 [Babylonia areolata]|uniref:uncharacterized protein LOC143299914 isoform X3 n=1 Tax=Babylonia areolata TaxID=304850 RepID=UPI003FD19748